MNPSVVLVLLSAPWAAAWVVARLVELVVEVLRLSILFLAQCAHLLRETLPAYEV